MNIAAGLLYALVLWAGIVRITELTKTQVEDELQAFLKQDKESR